ncbi:hypothetical protein SUDANB105_07755 [Streptomyces sp. enrichment culture]|uniref:hypothetical protein n=1 Tax=Streptomyces sp. enrichment culture TaxID=1795815 RepID=UPI003F561906
MIPAHTQPQPQQEQQPPQPQAETQAGETPAQETHAGGKVMHLHTAHPRVPIPYVTPGDMFRDMRTATSTATSLLPSPRKLAFYGALGAMAAVEILEWPIALAVGAATEVITREQAARQHAEHDRIERDRTEREQGQQAATEWREPGRPAQTATS